MGIALPRWWWGGGRVGSERARGARGGQASGRGWQVRAEGTRQGSSRGGVPHVEGRERRDCRERLPDGRGAIRAEVVGAEGWDGREMIGERARDQKKERAE